MTPLTVARMYFDAWNRRDPDAISALFAAEGTYRDPSTNGPLRGAAITGYARDLLNAFPDLTFDLMSLSPTDDGMVASQWRMRGRNTGALAGNPPTGRTLALPGADFIRITNDRIDSIEGYFDQRTFAEQLGLQVLTLPYAVGPVSFGPCCYVQSGRAAAPNALSMTSIQARSTAEMQTFWEQSRRIMGELTQTPGFVSSLTICIGQRGFTITTWEEAEHARQLLREGQHRDSVKQFFNRDFTAGAMTSVWVPQRAHTLWQRCDVCGRLVDGTGTTRICTCGEPLPESPSYW